VSIASYEQRMFIREFLRIPKPSGTDTPVILYVYEDTLGDGNNHVGFIEFSQEAETYLIINKLTYKKVSYIEYATLFKETGEISVEFILKKSK
jgi:hypothetical protein